MKTKSFDLLSSAGKHVQDKTLDFVGLYKSVDETKKVLEKRKSDAITTKETTKPKTSTSVRERLQNKTKKRMKQESGDVSQVSRVTSLRQSIPNDSSDSSTAPNTSGKTQGQDGRVKSIMKNKSPAQPESTESSRSSTSIGKPKKRNKSVSFMLDDNEEVMVKRTKSDDAKVSKKLVKIAKTIKDKKKNLNKLQKKQSEKENKASENNTDDNQHMEVDTRKNNEGDKKLTEVITTDPQPIIDTFIKNTAGVARTSLQMSKRQLKLLNDNAKLRHKLKSVSEATNTKNNNVVSLETKGTKSKKKKVKSPPNETTEAEGNSKADITDDLLNLSIGDNAHTLTNLLDEMSVVDKAKRKKLRQKFNKNKKLKSIETSTKEDTEKSEEEKEKVKWKKRKWNKDKKGDVDEEQSGLTVIVENLPLSMMFNYKKMLTELFSKHGPIKKIGIAEVYPTEESKPVFTTTITFHTDIGATKALENNLTYLENSRIRVKRALPATQTTLVVRSYAELTDQALSSTFHGVGKIRSIRHLVKGKKTMSTAFVEFDGPEAVERAIKAAGDTKIGGKKIHLAKFEIRAKKVKKQKNDVESPADADSEDSND